MSLGLPNFLNNESKTVNKSAIIANSEAYRAPLSEQSIKETGSTMDENEEYWELWWVVGHISIQRLHLIVAMQEGGPLVTISFFFFTPKEKPVIQILIQNTQFRNADNLFFKNFKHCTVQIKPVCKLDTSHQSVPSGK